MVEGEPPINFQKKPEEKRALEAHPATAIIRRMWNTFTGRQRDALWDSMSDRETMELVENLPDVPEDEFTAMAAKANRLFIRSLSSPTVDGSPEKA